MEKLGLKFECEFEDDGQRLVRYAINLADYKHRERDAMV
jgi:hypothetical protein